MGFYILTIIRGGQPVCEKNRCVFDLKWDTDGLEKTELTTLKHNILDSCGAENTKAIPISFIPSPPPFFPRLFFPDG